LLRASACERRRAGFVSLGITSDTAEFAVQSIRCWRKRMGRQRYPKARELTITADCGGSNGARVRLCSEAPLARTVRSNDILQVSDAAGEPVDAGDNQHVPFSQEIEHGAQLRAVRRAGA
jgi:hypothetical protein